MEALRHDRPPEYTAHDPDSLVLPSVPTHDFRASASPPVSLPDIKSLGLPAGHRPPPLQHIPPPPQQWPAQSSSSSLRSLPPPTPNYATTTFGAPLPSPMETDSVMSDGRMRAPSIISIDDPETREAAETLSVLRNIGKLESKHMFALFSLRMTCEMK
jgi:transcriptional repressor OPI1